MQSGSATNPHTELQACELHSFSNKEMTESLQSWLLPLPELSPLSGICVEEIFASRAQSDFCKIPLQPMFSMHELMQWAPEHLGTAAQIVLHPTVFLCVLYFSTEKKEGTTGKQFSASLLKSMVQGLFPSEIAAPNTSINKPGLLRGF